MCRAPLAAAVLSVEPSLGLLLPMPVVVRAEAPVVEAVDPRIMEAITGSPALEFLVADCATRFAAALHFLQAQQGEEEQPQVDEDWP